MDAPDRHNGQRDKRTNGRRTVRPSLGGRPKFGFGSAAEGPLRHSAAHSASSETVIYTFGRPLPSLRWSLTLMQLWNASYTHLSFKPGNRVRHITFKQTEKCNRNNF